MIVLLAAKAFQRASSAVEGRNGYLSQMQHNHRGKQRRSFLAELWSRSSHLWHSLQT